jgi:predicted O-methyltransferase YrrM
LVTLEVDPKHAAVARENLRRAELADKVEVQVGKALELLPRLQEQGLGPFDFTFIDADKQSLAEYFEWALRLSAKGSVIVVDNVVRKGAVVDAQSTDVNVQGVRRLNDKLRQLSQVRATTIQTVGSKGYDGFTLALVD